MLPSAQTRTGPLEQPNDIPVRVDIYVLPGRVRWQSRHGAHLAEERRYEAGACREADLADRDTETGWPALERRVVAEREVRLRHADRQIAEAQLFVQLERLGRRRQLVNAACPINADCHGLDLLAQRQVVRVEEPEFR